MPSAGLLDGGELGLDLGERRFGKLRGRHPRDLAQAHRLEVLVMFVRRHAGQVRLEHGFALGVGNDGFDRRVEIEPRGGGDGRRRGMAGMPRVGVLGERGRSGGGRERGSEKQFHRGIPSGYGSTPAISAHMNAA